jgi:hypothetical protein
MTRSALLLTVAGILLAATATRLAATTIIERTPEQLARESTLVVDGKVDAVRSYWSDDHSKIVTEATITVAGTHKGAPARTVRVVQLGGVVGNVRITAHGALAWKRGEEVLLFLESAGDNAYQVAGFSQGKYTIERDARSGKAFVHQALPPEGEGKDSAASGASGTATSERVTLQQFLDRVFPRR